MTRLVECLMRWLAWKEAGPRKFSHPAVAAAFYDPQKEIVQTRLHVLGADY